MDYVAVVERQFADSFKKQLKQRGFADGTRIAKKLNNGSIALPVNTSFVSEFSCCESRTIFCNIPFSVDRQELVRKNTIGSSQGNLVACVKSCCTKHGVEWNAGLHDDLPRKWEKHGDMLVLPANCFVDPVWKRVGRDFWQVVAGSFCCKRVVRKLAIVNNDFRSPNVELLLGEDCWVEHVDNKIRYSFDVRHCMFSPGNITEKLRIADINCRGQTVVDLYAGIGYFTLPYLVHAGAAHVYSCEWNPAAVEALRRNLRLNGVDDRCTVLFGDNTQVCPKDVADRVNLGLIPSSERSWFTACAALKPNTGGVLHIHGNVTSEPPNNRKKVQSVEQHGVAQESSVGLKIENESRIGQNFLPATENEISIVQNGSLAAVSSGYNCAGRNGIFANYLGDVSTEEEIEKSAELDHLPVGQNFLPTTVEHSDQTDCTESSCGDDFKDKSKSKRGNNGFHSRITKFAKSCHQKSEWIAWAETVCGVLRGHLLNIRGCEWNVVLLHVEHVKSYAPHVDHIVADIRCSPAQ